MTNLNQATANFVALREIRDDLVVLKDGALRLLIRVGSTNFDLKSTHEQGAIIKWFHDFLNSLDYSLQIVINSRRLDVKKYLEGVGTIVSQIQNELLKVQGQEYLRFVGGLAELGNIMSKQFYVVIPYQAVDIGALKQGLTEKIRSIFKPGASSASPTIPDSALAEYRTRILQRADVVLSGIQGMGLRAEIVGTDDLKKIFTGLYNPQ